VFTLARAIEIARGDHRPIVLGTGQYDANLTLLGDDGDGADDDDLVIQGCDATTVQIRAIDPARPVVRVIGARGVEISGVALVGGDRGLQVIAGGEVDARDIAIAGAGRIGAVVDGPSSVLDLTNVEIGATVPLEDGTKGWGVAVQNHATLHIDGGNIHDVHEVGVFAADGATIDITNTQIHDVVPNGQGMFGRGVHLQDIDGGSISDSSIVRVHDEGLFGLRVPHFGVNQLVIDIVVAGIAIGLDDIPTGDGLVFTAPSNSGYSTGAWTVTMDQLTVSRAARAGVLLENVDGTVTGGVDTTNNAAAYTDTNGQVPVRRTSPMG
jgi:hypothetical protein